MPREEIVRLALDALRAHKLRSFLTLLGIIIGVSSLIAVVSVVQGLNQYVSSRVMDFGSTSFSISKYSQGISTLDDFWRESKRKNLTLDDFNAVEAGCKHCEMVAAVYNENKTLKHKNKSIENVDLRGVTVNAPFIGTAMELDAGRHFTENDIEHARTEVIIGADVADQLYPDEDPIGKELIIDGEVFTIIGLAKRSGSFLGAPQDTFARIPMTVFTKKYNTAGKTVGIYAQSKTQQDMQIAMDETRVILRNRLHRMYNDDDGFSVATVDTFLTIWSNLTGSIFMVMIFVVSIALVVGGIVIMNIMLVSVTERTREIGLRKALGARQQDILGQFLAEAVMLAAIGGVIGVAAGGGVAALVAAFSPLPASVTLWSVFVAIFVSSAIGIIAGVYPARQAARLDPVVALRQE